MEERENDQKIFFLSIDIPWDLEIGESLSLITVRHEIFEVEGKMIDVALPSGQGSYMLGGFEQFERGFGRRDVDRFAGRFIYMGFFQVFKETCFGGHCFYNVQFVSPDSERASETYKTIKKQEI